MRSRKRTSSGEKTSGGESALGRRKAFDVKKAIVWVLTVFFSITFILAGNRVVTKELSFFSDTADDTARGEVIKVMNESSDETNLGGEAIYESTIVDFKCRILNGTHKGDEVEAQQLIDGMYAGSEYVKRVTPGDKILLLRSADAGMENAWQFSDYYRFDKVIVLAAVFMLLVLLIGRWKGVNTLISLVFTFSFVFFVFVPAVMAGFNAYLLAAVTSLFTIVMTLVLINGMSRKTLATIIGCAAGSLIAAAGTYIMSGVMELTGFIDEHSYYLTMLNPDKPMDLTAIIFAAVVIGALGAIMDIAMDISSSLFELSEHVPDLSFRQLYKSGMSIGRDIMGTMANTLVLAYIGSSLSSIMILLTFSTSAMDLVNREVIVVEFLQALIGSLAILLTIPCTVCVCGGLYLKKRKE